MTILRPILRRLTSGALAGLLLLAAGMFGGLSDARAQDEGQATLQGQVTKEGGEPAKYCTIVLKSETTPGVEVSVQSDRFGGYQARVPGGTYTVRFRYLLYPEDTHKGVVLTDGKISELSVALSIVARAKLEGAVVNGEDGQPLTGVTVTVSPLKPGARPFGALTGADGRFSVEVPVGTYEVSALLFSYRKTSLPLVEARVAGNQPLRIVMQPDAVKLKEVVVEGNRIKNTKIAELQTRKKSATVSDGINREAINRSTDSDAGQALGRVTGLSVRDGKYLVVRGLSERYASTQLNGVRIGSPEPNRKIVPLDLFPSGLLDNITIQKAYSPDQPGEFGGGSVQLTTRDIPENPITTFTVGTGLNSTRERNGGLGYRGGKTDYLGLDDGTRELPGVIQDLAGSQIIVAKSPLNPNGPGFTADELRLMASSFEDQWAPASETTPYKSDFSATLGRRAEIAGWPVGILGSVSYSRGAHTSKGERNFYQSVDLQPKALYREVSTNYSVLWGGTGTVTWRLSEKSTIKGTLFHSHSSDDEARRYQGDNFDFDQPFRSERLMFVQRSLTAGTVGSEHPLPLLGAKFDWKLNTSSARRDEPDRRENGYELLTLETDDGDTTIWRFSRAGASRLFSEVSDDDRGFEGHITIPFRSWAEGEAKIKFGGLNQEKDRASRTRRFSYTAGAGLLTDPVDSLLADANIGRRFNFKEVTRGTDYYWADQSLHAWYGLVELPISKRVRLLTGARVEKSVQTITTYTDQIFTSAKKSYGNSVSDVLPALNVTWAMTGKSNLRFAASQTVSRPDLRELTNFDLTDYQSGNPKTGNPNLKRATIQAFDVRWEVFPTFSELLAVSLFYKNLKDPIENTIQGGEAPREYPNNGEDGRNLGAEFEVRAALGRIAPRFERFSVLGNLTLVDSSVDLPASGVQTAQERPLEGQSPYVGNLGLFYTTPGGTELSFFYNTYGRRLTGVGIYGQPDIYERPQSTFDVTAARRFGDGLKVKLSAKNITNSAKVTEQGERVRDSSESGSQYSLSVTFGS